MTPDESRPLVRAIRSARRDKGLTQLKLGVAIGGSGGQASLWQQGRVPAARGRPAHPTTISRDQLAAIADALDCTPAAIADRAALTATPECSTDSNPSDPPGPLSVAKNGT